MIKVLFYGSCWTTNIGNAFVNLGAIHALEEALGDKGEVYHFGGMSSYLFACHGKSGNNLNLAKLGKFDYIVNAGMTQCVEHLQIADRLCRQFGENGAKLIILGGGGSAYTQDEVKAVRKLMKNFPLYAFVSRDTYSFKNYGDLAPYSHDGIDSAFFVNRFHKPIPLEVRGYNVLCFDNCLEPKLLNAIPLSKSSVNDSGATGYTKAGIVRRFIKYWRGEVPVQLPPIETLDMDGRFVLRTHHTTWAPGLLPRYFASPDCLISDLPGDYLSLYAQVHAVFSDRVHACIPALAFGNKAMLVKRGEPRIKMFTRLGAEKITELPVCIDMNMLLSEQEAQVNFLKMVFAANPA